MLGPQTQHKGTVYGDDENAPEPGLGPPVRHRPQQRSTPTGRPHAATPRGLTYLLLLLLLLTHRDSTCPLHAPSKDIANAARTDWEMEPAAAAKSSRSEPSEALVEQLSFYFTDANLRRDRFMKTFTGADGTGKMPVETLATFNRVKALTQDVGTIVAALRLIPGLQVSDPSDQEGHTVQRTRTLPAKDDSEVGSHLTPPT